MTMETLSEHLNCWKVNRHEEWSLLSICVLLKVQTDAALAANLFSVSETPRNIIVKAFQKGRHYLTVTGFDFECSRWGWHPKEIQQESQLCN